MIRIAALAGLMFIFGGCFLVPDVSHEPVVRNPFPQLSRVAVAPFHNLSDEPTVDGERFALAYYNELQATPGFEVVPVGVVAEIMRQHGIGLNDLTGSEARRLAQALDVDAVVVGAVTEYSPYYPPRCGLRISWYAANPCYHPIPAGYGLPWGTTDEEFIPEPLVYEAEMELARAQLATQSPRYEKEPLDVHPKPIPPPPGAPERLPQGVEPKPGTGEQAFYQATIAPGDSIATTDRLSPELSAGWPDPQGFVPPGPSPVCPDCVPANKPVLQLTQIYHGNDAQFTEALAGYEYFRDDARFGGWQSYLLRSDDFIRFCCRLHISEMLAARGGAGKTRVVWRWSHDR